MALAPVLINGKAYDHTQISCFIGGIPIFGITAINYDEDQEITDNFGTSKRPISRGYGRINTTASITMDMNEIEKIRDASPDRTLLGLAEFDVQFTFLNETKVVTHILKNAKFMKDGGGSNEGDMNITKQLDLRITHVEYLG